MSRSNRWGGHVELIGEKRNTYRVLVGKQEGKRPLERLKHTWESNTKIYAKNRIGWSLDRDQWQALVNTVKKLRVRQNVMKFFSS
jgi:hypothetical protein